MIAAIYARKSTQQDVADDAKSVRRQIEHAKAYAARRGWTVPHQHIYVDDGISGAEFTKRPAFVRLMAVLTPRPPFQALIVSEESRIGREQIEVSFALKQLIQAGVRVFSYLTDTERTLNSPIEKAMLALQTMADEMEREKARVRMIDTMMHKARAGHVTGGQCFGYDNVRVDGHVEYRINEAEAGVVRRIFELAGNGVGMPAIAKQLNADGARPPRAQQGRPSAWVQSSVHAVLHRSRYRGESVWNRTQKRDRLGALKPTDRDPREWIRVSTPQLRIVSDELWDAAHSRIAATRRTTNIRSTRDRDSRYLLPGLARCVWCNGGLHVRKRTRASGRHLHFYACTSHFNRGESVCGNYLQVPMEAVDTKVIGAITDLLRPELVDRIIAGVRAYLQPDQQMRQLDRIEAELASLDRQAANVADAIALACRNVAALVAKLQQIDERRAALLVGRDVLGDARPLPRVDWRLVERRARTLLTDWRGLLCRHTAQARPVLRQLLNGTLQITPILEENRRGFQFEGAVTAGELLAGYVGNELGVPGGIRGPLSACFIKDFISSQRAA